MAERPEVIQLLRTLAIPYVVFDSETAVNINCPFCTGRRTGRRDTKNRCGIFFSSLRFHCFRCKRVGTLYTLLRTIAGITWAQYETHLGRLSRGDEDQPLAARIAERLRRGHNDRPAPTLPKIDLPGALVDTTVWDLYPELRRFIYDRKFYLEDCELYEAHYPGRSGRWAYRLILPIADRHGKPVAFQGRDMTGRKRAKYLTDGPVGDLLYWGTAVARGKPIYIVEGIFDVWRMDWNVVGTFTHAISASQRRQLVLDPLVQDVVFCWDADSYEKSLRAAYSLAPIMNRVGVVRLPEGEDPDSLGGPEIRNLPIRWV